MKLEKLKLKNYRQYKDCIIEFAYKNEEKQITVIQGAMGTGKTNILNAITWCLYNKEIHISDADKGLPIINNAALKGAKSGDILEVIVEADLLDKENKRMIFKRLLRVKKTDLTYGYTLIKDDTAKKENRFSVHYQISGDYKIADEPEHRVEIVAPKEIQEYFFFDGERLNEYFKNPNQENIKQEVFKISQLNLFEKVIGHLRIRENEYAKQLKDISPKADETKTLLDHVQNELKEKKNRLTELRKDKSELEKKSNEIAEKLRNYPSSAEVRDLQEKRELLEKNFDIWNNEIEELKQKHSDYLIKNAPLLLCYTAICEAEKKVSKKIDSGEIPPDYKRSFIQKLLENGKCICLTDISSDSPARNNIEKVLNECDEISDITEELIKERYELERMLKALNSFDKTRRQNSENINKLENRCKEASKEQKNIEDKLSKIGDYNIERWESILETTKRSSEEKMEEIARLKVEIESLQKDIEHCGKEYEKQVRKIKEHDELRNKLLFCRKAMDISEKLKNEIMNEIRSEIEVKTNQQFFTLIWKQENYKKVTISEGYNISVLDQNNKDSIGTLSAGERQVLALSFMAALNMVSGFDAPIVIDTPLGRISKEPKINIAKNLHKYLKGKQVTLLVTEEEYTEEVRKHMCTSVSLRISRG
ncbi:MAG: Chromosome partition protein Smc [Candidatus Scalindua rubra]|uniref:Chromosome partition protein Smc n=1 Tax=Candidatus Scalindua rubra TaxID=1872076 RepID=A0A1E3X5J1_9BACT|nr:MAG: Chromosome partition protein Smc [Candidatus Scalindua rubra]